MFRFYEHAGDGAVATLCLNMADYLAARGPLLDRREWREHCDLIAGILAFGAEPEAQPPSRLATGYDLMEAFALKPGPQVGELLRAIEEAQAIGEATSRDDALRLAQSMLKEAGSSDGARSRGTPTDLTDGEYVA